MVRLHSVQGDNRCGRISNNRNGSFNCIVRIRTCSSNSSQRPECFQGVCTVTYTVIGNFYRSFSVHNWRRESKVCCGRSCSVRISFILHNNPVGTICWSLSELVENSVIHGERVPRTDCYTRVAREVIVGVDLVIRNGPCDLTVYTCSRRFSIDRQRYVHNVARFSTGGSNLESCNTAGVCGRCDCS